MKSILHQKYISGKNFHNFSHKRGRETKRNEIALNGNRGQISKLRSCY